MQNIIGRSKEKGILQNLLDSSKSELLAIYGRRRTGKTYLIREFFQDQGLFLEFTGMLQGRASEQLWNFSQVLNQAFCSHPQIKPPKNWNQAFHILVDRLAQIPQEKKVIIFFDELPWLATPRSDLLRSLEYLWNRHLSQRSNIIVILCGSAAAWMIKKIVNNRGGLHGRLTRKIHLQPFSLCETELFLRAKNIMLDRKQLVELYMVTGGIAKYLEQAEPGLSSAQIIQKLCFTQHGFLRSEFQPLLASLFEDSELHIAIIKALAKTRKGLTLSKISETTKKTISGRFSEALKDLVASGFVQFIPFYGRQKRDGLYRLVDEYCLFYLNWIQGKDPLIPFERSPEFFSWAGYAFENICIKHIHRIIKALDLPIVAKSIWYWDKKPTDLPGAQIDLIIDRTDRCINLLEMKFCEGSYSIKSNYSQHLQQRKVIFSEATKSRKTIFNTLITPFGATKNPPYLSSIDQQLTLDALFEY